jgi:hypothetical protein
MGYIIMNNMSEALSRFQKPHGLRRSSAAVRLLELGVRFQARRMDICLL